MNFSGLSAFPLTPMNDSGVLEDEFIKLIDRLAEAKVDSISILGSTGCYTYLSQNERFNVIKLALEHSQDVPVMVGIGALRTRDVVLQAEYAQEAGADALLLAPVSYQKLKENEVFELFNVVSSITSLPICVYDNPGTTNFSFTDELYFRLSLLPSVRAIKIPPVSTVYPTARLRIDRLKELLPQHISLGISGDSVGSIGLQAGCDAWYSGWAGLIPEPFMEITQAVRDRDFAHADLISNDFQPIWDLCQRNGTIRVIATAAQQLGILGAYCLPKPLQPIPMDDQLLLKSVLEELELSKYS